MERKPRGPVRTAAGRKKTGARGLLLAGDKDGVRQRRQRMNLRLVKTRLQQHIALFGPRIGVSCWSRDEHTDGERRRYRRRNTILIGNKLYDRDSAVRNKSIVTFSRKLWMMSDARGSAPAPGHSWSRAEFPMHRTARCANGETSRDGRRFPEPLSRPAQKSSA